MEQFWNIVHYFVYRGYCKLNLIANKFSPILYIYKNVPYFKRHFEKKGYDPEKVVNEAWERPESGISGFFAEIVMVALPIILLFGLHFFSFLIFWDRQVPTFEVFNIQITESQVIVYPMFVYTAISFLINYIFLLHKNKYLKYFKKFNKKPHKWKVKWAWISFGVILFPFIVLISSFVVLSE
jgi:hypothetical protein